MAVKPETEHKVVVKIGWTSYVMNMEAGLTFFRSVNTLEKMDSRYNSDTKEHEVFISPVEQGSLMVEFISEEAYRMGQLLYKAEQMKKQNQTTEGV